MDETISRGKITSGRVKDREEASFSRNLRIQPPVTDRYNLVYISLVLAGAGFLLPYNSFISAVDFYKVTFPSSSIMFDISLVYILTSLLAVLINIVLVDAVSLNSRIMFGYVVSIFTLGCVVVSISYADQMARENLYATTLTAVAAISLGATIQQSSFYGYTSMLPTRYSQAVMTGESIAGVITCLFRICTKLAVTEETRSTTIFFIISISILVVCLLIFPKVQKSEFVSFYISMVNYSKKEKKRRGTTALRDEEVYQKIIPNPSADPLISGTEDLQLPEFGASCRQKHRFRNNVEDSMAEVEVEGRKIGGNVFKCVRGLHGGLRVRLAVCKKIVPHMVGIALTYAVTLTLFPGIESEIESCRLGDWMPVLLITTFNISDLLGKVLAGIQETWSRAELVLWPLSRIILVPVLAACAAPKHKPVIPGELAPLLVTVVLGLSNGVFGSLPMILAPNHLPDHQREHSGNLMTIAYSGGLTCGALLAYWLDYIIGSSQGPPCVRNFPATFGNSTATSF